MFCNGDLSEKRERRLHTKQTTTKSSDNCFSANVVIVKGSPNLIRESSLGGQYVGRECLLNAAMPSVYATATKTTTIQTTMTMTSMATLVVPGIF